jgi:hypothetical protein
VPFDLAGLNSKTRPTNAFNLQRRAGPVLWTRRHGGLRID